MADWLIRPASSRGRAARLLLAGAIGGTVGAIGVFAGFSVLGKGGSALLGAAAALAFFAIGQLVQVALAEAEPMVVLVGAVVSYLVRVAGLALFAIVLSNSGSQVDPLAVGVSVIVVVVCWLVTEIAVFARMRILVYDSPEPSRPARAGGRPDT